MVRPGDLRFSPGRSVSPDNTRNPSLSVIHHNYRCDVTSGTLQAARCVMFAEVTNHRYRVSTRNYRHRRASLGKPRSLSSPDASSAKSRVRAHVLAKPEGDATRYSTCRDLPAKYLMYGNKDKLATTAMSAAIAIFRYYVPLFTTKPLPHHPPSLW
ncbi:hypothetical protein ElyMa_004026600 [Elysia marginata]|uniref:Uncharacterized protein n=1 Tax=Elysia marginata TaxID=1093978 RepID=A0AAV4G3T5_9GAST|nr:hypothetical protein ElyMa_004026600 [Elysia marginata]